MCKIGGRDWAEVFGRLEDAYRMRTPGSAAMAMEAARYMPGGDTRATVHHAPYPLTFRSGEGAWLVDVDGNRYVDLSGNYTSLVHGNAYPPIVESVQRALSRGTAWAGRAVDHVELARLICERVASVDAVRFCNSGSEANMLAVELARSVTGRDLVLMAAHGYHGSFPDLAIGSTGRSGPRTLVAPFGDADAFEQVLEAQGRQVALVIVEPVLGAGGIVSPPPDFLARVARAATAAGALFCLDEVITFRLDVGGAQAVDRLQPDLTTFGKVIGGGLPVGALGGRIDLMERFAPGRIGGIHHSGTFNGNPVTSAAGLVAVSHLTVERIEAMDARAARLAAGLQEAASSVGLPFSVRRRGSLLNCYLSAEPPGHNGDRSDGPAMSCFHLAALAQGVFFAERGTMATCSVMDDAVIDEAIARLAAALDAVAELDPVGA